MKLVAYIGDDGLVKFRAKRTDYGEMLQAFTESSLPKNYLVFSLYKVYWKMFKKNKYIICKGDNNEQK